jgi:hypothetical protein
MQEEYLTLEPLAAIRDLKILPFDIQASIPRPDVVQNVAERIAGARKEIEKAWENLSWDGDIRFSQGPVSVQIVGDPDTIVKYDEGLGKIQIGQNALSLNQDAFTVQLQQEFRKALLHGMAQDLGKMLKIDIEKQRSLEEKMLSIVEKGTPLSEFILFCNMSDELSFEGVSDFLDRVFNEGAFGYDEVERYIASKQQEESETPENPTGTTSEFVRSLFEPAFKFLKAHPVLSLVPIAVMAAVGSVHAADFGPVGGGFMSHPMGQNHQAFVSGHVLHLGGQGSEVTTIGSELLRHVNVADIGNLTGENPTTRRQYDTKYLGANADKIFKRATEAIRDGNYNQDVSRVVAAFQHKVNSTNHEALAEDGVIGQKTIGALNSLEHAGTGPHLSAAAGGNPPDDSFPGLSSFFGTGLFADADFSGAGHFFAAGPGSGSKLIVNNVKVPASSKQASVLKPVSKGKINLSGVEGKSGPIDQKLINLSQANIKKLAADREEFMKSLLKGRPINFKDGKNKDTKINIIMNETARKNLIFIQDQLYSGANKVPVVIGSIDRNNLHASLQVIKDIKQLIHFLYDKDTETIAKEIPCGAEPIDLANIENFRTIDPSDIYKYELAGRPFLTLVKFKDADNVKRTGILWAGEEAAKAKFDLMQSTMHDSKMKEALVKILGIFNRDEQLKELAKPEMAKLFKGASIPEKGLLTTARVIPDKWGNIDHVDRFMTEGEIVKVQKSEPLPRVAYVINKADGSSREMEYVSSLSGVWIQFSEISSAKEELLKDKEHGTQYLDQYYPETFEQVQEKPRYLFGPNKLTVEIAENEFGLYAAQQEKASAGKNLELQISRRNLNVVLDVVGLGLSALGLPGSGVVEGLGPLFIDITHSVKDILPGPVSDVHKDELVGWVLFSQSDSSHKVTFEEWINTQQTNPDQFDKWTKKGHEFRTSAFSEQQIAEVDYFLTARMNEAEVGKFMSVAAQAASLSGQVMGLDSKTVQSGRYQFQEARLNGLASVLTQPVIAWDGSSINLIQSVALIAKGQILNYVNINDILKGGVSLKVLFPYIGFSVDTRSFINALGNDPLNPAFINAPKHLRLNLSLPLWHISENWEIDFSKEHKKLLDDDSIEGIVVEDGLFRSHAYGYTKDEMKKLSVLPGQARISVGTLSDGNKVVKVPVYVKYDPISGEKTVLILKENAIHRTIKDLEKTRQTYVDYERAAKEGALFIQVSPDGGTYAQNISTHMYASYSQGGQIFYPLGKSVDELNLVLRAIASNDKQKAKDILAYYYDHLKANTKLGETYAGAPESLNVQTGEAAAKNDHIATALFGLGLIKFNEAYPDEKINGTQEALTQIHNRLLQETKNGSIKNGDEAAYMYAFFSKFGDTTSADMVKSFVKWDETAHLMRYKADKDGFASSTTLLWMRVLGPQGFAEQFLGGAQNTDGLMDVINSIHHTFGEENGKELKLLDAVDATLRPSERPAVGFVAETSDYVGVMKQILTVPLMTPLNDQQRQELQSKVNYYSHNLKELQSKGGSPSIPEAIKRNVRSGKDYFTATGNKALGAFLEYETQVVNNYDLLSGAGSLAGLPGLPNADRVSEEDLGHTRVVPAGRAEREKLQKEYQVLAQEQKKGQSPAYGHYVEFIDPTNDQEISETNHGVGKHIIFAAGFEEREENKALVGHQRENAERYGHAIRGEGEFANGAAFIYRVGENNTVADAVTIGGREILNSSDMRLIMEQIQRLPALEKYKIERQRYTNFTMDLNFHGYSGKFVVSIVFPLHKETIMTQVSLDTQEQTVEVYKEGLKLLSISPKEISVPKYDSLGVEVTSNIYGNTFNHAEGLAHPEDYVAQVRQMIETKQLPLDGMTLTTDCRGDTVADENEMTSRKIFIDLRNGDVEADTYGVYLRATKSVNGFFITNNHLNPYGFLKRADVFNNGKESQAPLNSELTPQELLDRLLNPVEGDKRFVNTTPVNDKDRDLFRFSGHLPISNTNVITGATRIQTMDMSTGLKLQIATDAHGVKQQAQALYDKLFFGGRIPYRSIIRGSSGAVVKFTNTLDYDPITQQMTFLEVDMTSGKPVVTTNKFDSRWEGYVQSTFHEGATGVSVVTHEKHNRNETSSTIRTFRHAAGAQETLLSEGNSTLAKGNYNVTMHKFSEGNRHNNFETTKSVISPANGLVLDQKTLNPLWNNTVLREFVPIYNADGIMINGREYTFSPKYDRHNKPYDGTIVLGSMNSNNKPVYYFKNDPSGRKIYTVNGQLLTSANKADVVGRFINRGIVQLINVPAAQAAYSGRPLTYIEEQNDQGGFKGVHYVSELEDRVVANVFRSVYEPNTFEMVFNSALASNKIYGMAQNGTISRNPVAFSYRQKMLTGIPDVFGRNGQNTINSMLYTRKDVNGTFQREYGLNAFGEENLNLYYSPGVIRYNSNAKGEYTVRGKAIVGRFDQPVRGILHYDDQYQMLDINAKPVHGWMNQQGLIGKATRLDNITFSIPPEILVKLPGGLNTVSKEEDFIKHNERFFILNTVLNRPVVELNALPSNKDHNFVAQVIFNPFTITVIPGPDRGLYRAYRDGNNFIVDANSNIIMTTNLQRHLSMDNVMEDPIIKAAVGPFSDGMSNHRQEVRRIFEKTVRDIAHELGGDPSKFTYNISNDSITNDGTRFFVRIDQDPESRVILYVSSDEQPSLIVNKEFSGQSPLSAYEISQDGQIYKLEAGSPMTVQEFLESKSIPGEWKDSELAKAAIYNQKTVTPVSRYLLVNPVVSNDGIVNDGKGKILVLVRLLGDNDPLNRDYVKLDRSAVRFTKYDESAKAKIPLTVPQGEIAVAKTDKEHQKVIRETNFFQMDKNKPEYIYSVVREYKDGYVFTSNNKIFIGYNFKTGITWEHYVPDEIKIYSLDSFPIESVRVPATFQEFLNGINGVAPTPQEYLYSQFKFKTLVEGENGYIKTKEDIQTMTPNAPTQDRVTKNNEISYLASDGHYSLDVFEKSFKDQVRNSPMADLVPEGRTSEYGDAQKIDKRIEAEGQSLDLKNNLTKPKVWKDGLRKFYYSEWFYKLFPNHPVINNWVTGLSYLGTAVLSVLSSVHIVSSRWLKGVWRSALRFLGRAAGSVNANNASFDRLSQVVDKEIAKKLLILRQVNGQFITAANVKEENDKKNYLESYLLKSGFSQDEFDDIWSAVSNKELTFNKTDNDPRDAMEAVGIDSGLDEEGLKALIKAQAERGYPQALALQEIISRGVLESGTLKALLAEVPDSYQGQMAWSQLLRLALIKSENHVLTMLADNDPQAIDQLRKLIITPETRLLIVLLDSGYLNESDVKSLAKEYLGKAGTLKLFKEFAFQILTDQVINPAIDDVYNSTFKYAGDGINPTRMAEVRQSIISEVHRFLMLDPSRITDKTKAEKSEIEFNPYPMTKLFETNNIRQFVLFKFIQMAPSDTNGYSLGALSLFYPLIMFITGDAMRLLDADKNLSQEARAKEVLTRIKAHGDLWRSWFTMNLWGDGKPGLFKMLTDPEERQPEEFRQTDLFIETDLYKLMMFLNRLEDGKGYLLFGEMARMIKEGGFDPTLDRKDRNLKMTNMIKDVIENGKGSEITNDEFIRLNEKTAQLLAEYRGYIGQGANKQSSSQYKNFMDFIKNKIFTTTDVFKEAMLVFLKEKAPYAVAADQLTKTWRGVSHLWLVRIIVPLAGMFKSFWSVPSGWRRAGAYVLTAGGLLLSGVILATQEHMMAWGILTAVLSLGWPKMLLGKVKLGSERLFWMSVYGLASTYQFGILVYHLFGKFNTIHYDTFGFAITVALFAIMTLPTYLSTFHAFNALWSYVRLSKRTWSKDFVNWIGLPALFRLGGHETELYGKIIRDAIDIEKRFSPVTPNGEPVQEFLKRVFTRSGLFTKDELGDWVDFIDNPQRPKAPKLPRWDKAQEFLYMTFFSLVQKKPQTDNPAYLQATSSHVLAAGELVKNLFEIKALPGSFDKVETEKGARETAILGHLLDYHKGRGLENVVIALKDIGDPGIANFASKLEKITAVSDMNGLLDGLNGDQIWEIVQILEGFMDEVMANNYAVIESQGVDITEMHIYMARHFGDDAYVKAVTAMAQKYTSLKAAKVSLEGMNGQLTQEEQVFNERYAAYAELVLLKYRPIFHEISICGSHVQLEGNRFVFNSAKSVFKSLDKDALAQNLTPDKVGQLLEAHASLKKIYGDFKYGRVTKDMFSEAGLDGDKIWNELIKMGYITEDGKGKFDVNELNESFKVAFPEYGDKEFVKIQEIVQRALYGADNLHDFAAPILETRRQNIKEIITAFNTLRSVGAASNLIAKFIEGYESFMQIIVTIEKTHSADVYLPFYKQGELDNPIPRNKNGGIGANLWIGNGRSSNYDAWVRAYPGQNSYRLSWATLVGRNPEIMIVNPIMRIWASSNDALPVTSHYSIAQHTWVSDTQRGREYLTTFYGKALVTPTAGDTVVSHPGEDSAAFLAIQDEEPDVISTQEDYFAFEWGRPSLIKTIYTTEQRYGFNVTLFIMFRTLFSVFLNPNVGYDVKLTHLALFMYYMSVRLGLLLMVSLPFGSMFSSFANLTPAVILTGVSYIFMTSVNFATMVRHLRETGSVWTTIRRTVRDVGKAHPMFVGILPMIDKGVWSATHEIYKFVRTFKAILLTGETDKERHQELKLFSLPAHVSPKAGKIVAATGLIMAIGGIVTALLSRIWLGPALTVLGSVVAFAGSYMASRTKAKLPFYGIVGTLGVASWLATLFVSLPTGPGIYLPYLLASIAALTGHKVYLAFYDEQKGRIKGVDYTRMFGSWTGMKVFAGLLVTRIFSGSLGLINNDIIQSIWGLAIIAAGIWSFKNVWKEGVWQAAKDFKDYLGFGKHFENLKKFVKPSNPSGPTASSAAPKNADKAMMVRQTRAVNRLNRVNPGGIDLGRTVVTVKNSGGSIRTAFDDPAILRLLLNSDGLTPIIYNIKIMTPSMVDHFVGLN